MSDTLVWADLMRPLVPLVYIDLNHFIGMARAQSGDSMTPHGYGELWRASRKATQEGRALVVLSAAHLFELTSIADPRQRSDIADVMEVLSDFRYLLGRVEIAECEIAAGVASLLGETSGPEHAALIGDGFGWAFGMRGGLTVSDGQGRNAADTLRTRMGEEGFANMRRLANRTVERSMLDGPADHELENMRTNYGYAPETAQLSLKSRLDFELNLSMLLASDPKWRRGRLRDVVSARETSHEWLDSINAANDERQRTGRQTLHLDGNNLRALMSSMPHSQVAITMKTRYHRDPGHVWTTNDIVDIDAMSVAYAYCEVAFTDKAARSALVSSPELRVFNTFVPRTPVEMAEWFDKQPLLDLCELLVPSGSVRQH